MININKSYFFNKIRESKLFRGSLSQSQVEGINGIFEAWEKYGDGFINTLAYAFATAYHETGAHMVPVREGFANTDVIARRRTRNRAYGKPAGVYGHVYYGRGIVQLTWLENYKRTGDALGVDLVKDPDLAMKPEISARILIEGLIDGRWNAKGHGIQFYLRNNDLKNARRTVNVLDKWELIKGYYETFLDILEKSIEENDDKEGE